MHNLLIVFEGRERGRVRKILSTHSGDIFSVFMVPRDWIPSRWLLTHFVQSPDNSWMAGHQSMLRLSPSPPTRLLLPHFQSLPFLINFNCFKLATPTEPFLVITNCTVWSSDNIGLLFFDRPFSLTVSWPEYFMVTNTGIYTFGTYRIRKMLRADYGVV